MYGIINRIKNGFKAVLVCAVIPLVMSACWDDLEEISGKTQSGIAPSAAKVTYNVGIGHTSGTVPVDNTDYSSGETVTVLDNTGDLRGAEVAGDHVGSGIKQRFIGWNSDSEATTAEYVAGNTFAFNENITLYAIYTTGTDVLRKVGPAGGWVFYDHGSNPGWGRYLEAAPQSTEWTGIKWQDPNSAIGGTSFAIGTGRNNTQAIVDWLNANGQSGCAAQLSSGLTHGGESDWFLPSRDELNQIYINLYLLYDVGGFFGDSPDSSYWSSSEGSDVVWAWDHDFYDGSQSQDHKYSTYNRVRAVRAF